MSNVRQRLLPLLAVTTLLCAACGDEAPEAEAPSTDDTSTASTPSDTVDVEDSPDPEPVDDPETDDPETDDPEIDEEAQQPVGNDPLLIDQWGLPATNVPTAWTVTGGDGVVIAIIDSGVDLDHPDLVDRLVPGRDFVDGDDEPDDPNGHGTHVAGIAAASSNDIGIAGVAPHASIMPVRVLDAAGGGSDEIIAEAIRWAAANGADVINLSLGEAGFISRFTKGSALNAAIRKVSAEGVIVVAASGNEGSAGQQYRLGVDLLVVNATGRSGDLTSFSNVGDVRSISAPGADILSTAPSEPTTIWPDGTDGYAPLDGTSMAAPLVSGVAALALAAGVPAGEVIDLLTDTASNPTGDVSLGAGIVDAAAALGLLDVVDAPVDQPTKEDPEPPRDGSIEEQIRSVIESLDGTLDASCEPNRRSLTVSSAATANDLDVVVAAELVIARFVGAGSYPATGTVTVSSATQSPIVVPVLGTSTVDDAGNGSITVSVEGQDATVRWRCI